MLGPLYKRLVKDLDQNGRRAPATVVKIGKRGTSSGTDDSPQPPFKWKLTLRVEPEAEPAFELTTKMIFPTWLPKEREEILIIYDPEDTSRIVWDRATETRVTPEGIAKRDAVFEGLGYDSGKLDDLLEAGAQIEEAEKAGATPSELDPEVLAKLNSAAEQISRPAAEDPHDRIERLAALRKKGAITDAEFEAQKAEILGSS